ncbi:MAG: putative toxin-antitoxin system toxin component, PIN family [bacterium]
MKKSSFLEVNMLVVLDTNVLFSAIFWRTESYKIVKMIEEGKIKNFISNEILNELRDILTRKNINGEKIEEIVTAMVKISKLIKPLKKHKAVINDPKDDIFVDCAVAAEADYIITKDKHILSLGEYMGTGIVTPREFLEII